MSLSFDNSESGCMLFYDCHRSVPAPFLTKTYHLVNDPSTDEIVSWGEDHTTFVVWRPPEFARDLLPNYFKHNNFSSFVRQLNTYGFRKVVPDRWEFANDFFRRGERHLLCEIHRRKALQQPTPGNSGSGAQQSRSLSPSTSIEDQAWGSPISSPLPSPIPMHINVPPLVPQQPQPQLQHPTPPFSISDENERLRKDNNLLLSEVSRLRRLYEDTISMIQHQFKGSSPEHFTTLVSSARIGASGGHQSSDRVVLMGPTAAAARRDENHRELSVHVRPPPATPEFFCKNPPAVQYPPIQDHNTSLQQRQQQYQQQQHQHLQQQHQQHQQQHQQHQQHQQQERNIISDSKLYVGPFLTTDSKESPPSSTDAKHDPLPVKLFGVPLQHSQGTSISNNNNNSFEQPTLRHGLHATEGLLPQIPLAGTKRRQPEQHPPHDCVFLRPPPGKCLQGSSEIAAELSRPAPWLQICATRDEGVYI